MAVAAQTDSTPLETSCMYSIDPDDPQQYVAVSRDLRELYPCGTPVLITGTEYDGIYIVADTMHPKWSNRIDLLIHPSKPIGKWQGVIHSLQLTKTTKECLTLYKRIQAFL